MLKRALPVVCLHFVALLLAAIPGRAVGLVVFDPSNFEQAVLQLLQLEQQYRQMVQTYQTLRSQYDHMVRMARTVPVNMSTRYRAITTEWRRTSASNRYNTTSGWINSINSGSGVDAGYNQATRPLEDYGAALAIIPRDQLDRVKTNYATVELTDGANRHAMETLGRLRSNAAQVEGAIRGLEDDSLSLAPDMNTEIAVLNKINAANLIAIRSAQDANKILVSLTEQQVIEAKRKRDAEAQAFHDHARFLSEGRALLDAQARGASDAMKNWRMP